MLERSRCRDHRGHHPWWFIGQFPDWQIVFVDYLPNGRWGQTIHRTKKVKILNGLSNEERRSTLAHEIGHVVRGPFSVCHELYEESLVERQAARLLMPSVRKIGHAMAFHHADYEKVAEELWVDIDLFHTRLSTPGAQGPRVARRAHGTDPAVADHSVLT